MKKKRFSRIIIFYSQRDAFLSGKDVAKDPRQTREQSFSIAMSVIDPVFFDKKFSVQRYMLRYVVGAATDELRDQQLQKVRKFRAMADEQIDGVIDQSFVNFNTSLARFTAISNQLQGRLSFNCPSSASSLKALSHL
jgi:hypothetical protein